MNRRYELTLEAAPQADDPDGARRLRSALKVLLRRFGLRCVQAKAVDSRVPNPDGSYSYPFLNESQQGNPVDENSAATVAPVLVNQGL